MEKLVIDRQTWLRGEGSDHSKLLSPATGKMCCLGFACIQLAGLKPDEIKNHATPALANSKEICLESVKKIGNSHLSWLLKDDLQYPTVECTYLMNMNDQEDMTEAGRESYIKEVFAMHNIEVEFIN